MSPVSTGPAKDSVIDTSNLPDINHPQPVDQLSFREIDSGGYEIVSTHENVNINTSMSMSTIEATQASDTGGGDTPTIHMMHETVIQPISSVAVNEVVSDMRLIDVEDRGCISSKVFASPNGTMLWKADVPTEFKPFIGVVFDSWSDALKMYNDYADKAGFSTRLGTTKKNRKPTKDVTHKYVLCNRAGTSTLKNSSFYTSPSVVHKRRRTKSNLTNCGACIRFKVIKGTPKFSVQGFVETHNHRLIDKDNMDFSRKRRKMGFDEQQFVHQLSLNKIGATRAHKIRCSIKGGVDKVRGTAVDFKNYARDIRVFITSRDAQLVVDTLSSRMANLNNFFFHHEVVNNELRFLFWADGISRCNYEVFGDVLAFDATYKTNQYGMIFVPFTGIDHHKRCVTFGAALLYDEKTETYKLLLDTFLKAHKKQPVLVYTDQDGAMKSAVEAVFTESVHHLCAWHIMDKLPAKLQGEVLDSTAIRAGIKKLVWDKMILPSVFEEKWQALIDTHKLRDVVWLNTMYGIRKRWVPCYFREVPLSNLMSTTSRCESTNVAFKLNSSASNTLVQFLLCFDTAIDWQRYHQREEEFASDTAAYSLLTETPFERHASLVYTNKIFLEVQKEIDRSQKRCLTHTSTDTDGNMKYTISQFNKKRKIVANFEVKFDPIDKSASCTCLCFTRVGYLCRHIFAVYSFNEVDEIPDRYVLKRWRRGALPKSVYSVDHRYSADNDEESKLRSEIIDIVTQCADRLRSRPDKLTALRDDLLAMQGRILKDVPVEPACNNKDSVINYFYGSVQSGSDTVIVAPGSDTVLVAPEAVKHKGRHSDARIVGEREKAIEQHKKVQRKCTTCGRPGHNARSCAKVTAATALASGRYVPPSVGPVGESSTNRDS
ncbi:hypothetical protein SSX86_006207 [Deinandra increscens subsp. villosa]|uniref:Protein FAR1-RELATED SEQUENCE n=1 Tax=Deinandra increscens subsp. villosa TaxID=3103831 RepID=A0AAP0DN21_9ASTR